MDPDTFSKEHGGWGLDVVVRGTLTKGLVGKIARGDQAPKWFQSGEWGKLVNYCLDDVTLERDLAVFVEKYGFVVNGNSGMVVRL